ncbi:MAG: hypothetical protein IT438_01335 [Phycisphaerales bacterium]|nr:hypothetical protein [Phycisphaerales bacterium]
MPDLLPTIISAAATSLVVAAVFLLVERLAARRLRAFRPGAFAGSFAIGAGFVVAKRLALGGWPDLPAPSADGWLLWIACGLILAAILVQLRFFHSIVGPAVLGMLAAGALTEWALARVLGNSLSPESRRFWVAGIAVVFTLACAAAAMATATTGFDRAEPRPSLLARFRDDHWGTFAIGLMLAFATPAIIFSSSIKFGQAMLGLSMAWAGVALVSLFAGLPLIGAGALTLALYGCLWCTTYFLASSSGLALALAAIAPLGLLLGYLPALRARPIARFLIVSTTVAGLAATSAAVLAPTYFHDHAEDSAPE